MRRLLAGAAVAAVAFGVTAPASAAWSCHGVESGTTRAGVCAGSWCVDECWIVAWTYCEGANAKVCTAVDGLGAPPGR
jgi:hypothetical protein